MLHVLIEIRHTRRVRPHSWHQCIAFLDGVPLSFFVYRISFMGMCVSDLVSPGANMAW